MLVTVIIIICIITSVVILITPTLANRAESDRGEDNMLYGDLDHRGGDGVLFPALGVGKLRQ